MGKSSRPNGSGITKLAISLKVQLLISELGSANKSGEFNDYSVCTTWGVFDRHNYLLNVFVVGLITQI